MPFAVIAKQPAGPDAGQLLNEYEQTQKLEKFDLPEEEEAPKPLPEPKDKSVKVKIISVDFVNYKKLVLAKELSYKDLQKSVADAIGKTLDFNGIMEVTQRVTRFLRKKGFLLAFAYLPEQNLSSGKLKIAIKTGRIDGKSDGSDLIINGKDLRVDTKLIRNIIAKAVYHPSASILKLHHLERGLMLANDLPGINVRSSLRKGSKDGTSALALAVSEDKMIAGSASVDNFGNRYTGKERANAGLQFRGLAGWGDNLGINLTGTSGMTILAINYAVPIGYDGLILSLGASDLSYKVGKELKNLKSEGEAKSSNIGLKYPIIRTRALNLNTGLSIEQNHSIDRASGLKTRDKKTQTIRLSLDGARQDNFGGGGVNNFSLTLSNGDMDLSGSAQDLEQDQQSARTNGNFTKIGFDFSRLQRINDRFSLSVGFRGQNALRNLDSSEKFILGGPQGVRAYPVGEASGDNGYLAKLELKYDVAMKSPRHRLEFSTFFDTGQVTLNKKLWPFAINTATKRNSYTLSGVGLAMQYSFDNRLLVNTYLAQTLGTNPGRTLKGANNDNLKDNVQFVSNINYLF